MDTMFGWLFAGVAVVAVAFIFFFILILAAAAYIMTAIGLNRLAQRRGLEHHWFAWIPILRWYIYAKIIGEKLTVGQRTIKDFPVWYTVIISTSGIVSSFLALIPFIGWLASALVIPFVLVVQVYVMYRFFSLFEDKNAVAYTVIGTLIPFGFPILLLILKEKPMVEAEV